MKRALLLLVGAAVLVVGVFALAEMTQNRPDPPRPGSRSEVVLQVSQKSHVRPTLEAAQNLLGACQGTVPRHRLNPSDAGEERVRVVTEPALGDHAWRRFRGCLEDFTLDLVKAGVVTKRDLPVGQ